MATPAIILGDPRSILRLPAAAMRNRGDWKQLDSDILAHFLQVHGEIHRSRWNASDIRFAVQGDQVLSHAFPDFEAYVFVAVYFRQLISSDDHLLKDAVTRYRRFVDCPIRSHWVEHERDAFNKVLCREPSHVTGHSVRDIFDAFLYGASLMHKIPVENDPKRKLFLEIFDNQPRHTLLFALNMSLKMLLNHVGNIAAIVYRDYAHWLHNYELPLPDTRWHQSMFALPRPPAGQ